MNKIDRVEVKGFWGNKSFEINFHSDINFFIGVNGSGKTTIINIIASTLSADFSTIDRLPFELVRIELSEVSGKRKPVIEVEKIGNEKSPYTNIKYRIKEKATEKFQEYSLNEFEEETFLRRGIPPRNFQQLMMKQMNRGVIAKLKSIVNISWLSIHRTTTLRASEENYESSVDQKLNDLSSELSKYFAVLSSKTSEKITEFQKNIILLLLTEKTRSTVFSSIKSFDLEEEKKVLYDIFSELKIGNTSTKEKIDKHFQIVSSAREKIINNESIEIDDLTSLFDAYKNHKIAQDWNDLLKKQTEILSPKITFIEMLNRLFKRKKVYINDKNEIEAKTDSGKILSIRGLSSGEKQLIIILGEALLQQSSPWIYIADEPELSLHVRWQENLIENIMLLNPKAQIICATHSPDIVSIFSQKIFDMEDQIK